METLPHSSFSWLALGLFIFAYHFVIAEEFLNIKKSKPMVLAAGLIWIVVGIVAHQKQHIALATDALNHYLADFAQLLLFLIVAMTYVNALEERNVFEALQAWLIKKNFSAKSLFWITGFLGFFLSSIADNLTSALVMGAVVITVAKNSPKFIALACINIVVAVNAGGAFCPFGDITTLMVWQKELVSFSEFFHLFLPSLINYLVPAALMSFALPKQIAKGQFEKIKLKPGATGIAFLFILTIVTSVLMHHLFHYPPSAGMMLGLAYLQVYAIYLQKNKKNTGLPAAEKDALFFDVFQKIQQIEWDTLLFFYGVILSVGGLATLGFLSTLNTTLYQTFTLGLSNEFAATPANITMGFLSAVIDNIPVMYSILAMNPDMALGQWLLVTLTTGVGGSLLSVGSAAGVALMGQSAGHYTFFSHFKWVWAILLGYIASIVVHLYWNAHLF